MTALEQLRHVLSERTRWDGFEGEVLRFATLSLESALEEAFHYERRDHHVITSIRGYIGEQHFVVGRDQIVVLWRDMIYRDANGSIVKPLGVGAI